MAAIRGWELHQLDVNNTLLNRDSKEEVFVKIPQGFGTEKGMVCNLNKSLYRLKQASCQWFGKLSDAPLKNDFQQSFLDNILFTMSNKGTILIVLVYVDDIIVTGNNKYCCQQFKQYLQACFHTKELGELHYNRFLGKLLGK